LGQGMNPPGGGGGGARPRGPVVGGGGPPPPPPPPPVAMYGNSRTLRYSTPSADDDVTMLQKPRKRRSFIKAKAK
jgi:hypothetical protein